ncbi:MAG TPA: LPXTG cell wall anchor domain-containing protein [Chloroflexia bacterium]
MKRLSTGLVVMAVLGVLAGLWTLQAFAHAGRIVSSTQVKVGPYTLDVLYYSSPQVGEAIPITIAPRPVTAGGQVLNTRPQLQATLQPSPGMSASEIRLRVYDDPDQPAFYAVDPVVDERGIWVLQLTVEGEAGTATGSTKVVVAGPGGSEQAPAQPPAQAPAPAATPAPASTGPGVGIAIPVILGLALLGLAGWWLLRRPASRKEAPVRRRR